MDKKYIKNQLLCTFSKPKYLEKNIDDIMNQYKIINNKIIVINNIEDEKELFCIYNIIVTDDSANYPNTILIHRKRKTNTIYTINSLNHLVWLLNGGKFSHEFIVPWENYRNTLWRVKNDELDVVKTKLYKTFKFD
jgi:hypothetical protein